MCSVGWEPFPSSVNRDIDIDIIHDETFTPIQFLIAYSMQICRRKFWEILGLGRRLKYMYMYLDSGNCHNRRMGETHFL